jgi:two-component system, LytTR family, sensor kinase
MKNFRYWALQIIGWGLYVAFIIYQSSKNPDPNANTIYADVAFGILGILCTHTARIFFYKNNWNKLPTEKLILRVIFSIAFQVIIVSLLYIALLSFFYKDAFQIVLKSYLAASFFISLLLLSSWHLFYFISKFIQRNRGLVIERLQMENSVKSLEIKTIRNNLQPHFIFNALNSIRALVDEDPARARMSITQLSNILRSSIQVDKVDVVPLKKEMEIVKDYLSLESIRYEERLTVSYNIHNDTLALPIAPLMLQTLVENAIKHGIAAHTLGGQITITSYIASATHFITICNTGQYDPGYSLAKDSEGFGLESSRERLKYLFGEKAHLDIKNHNQQEVILTISIPIKN